MAAAVNYQWIGPSHTVLDLRAMKRHLDSGCLVYVCRSVDEIAAIAAKGPHERTSASGSLLNVSTHPLVDQSSALAQEIDLAGACFIARTAIPHETVPTVRYYALARSQRIAPVPLSDLSYVTHLYALWSWLKTVVGRTTFMFSQ